MRPTWDDVLAHVTAHGVLYYQAPLDYRAILVLAQRRGNGRKVRIIPASNQADPFWADVSHLDRISLERPALRGESR